MILKRIAAALVAVALLGLLSSCSSGSGMYSNFREVERLKLIKTIGVDSADGGVRLTAGTGVGLDNSPPVIYLKSDVTMAAAVDALEKNSMKSDAYFSHTEHVLIGEDAAREGISSYLDFVARAMQMRLDTNLFIVRGGSAEELICGAADEEHSAADMLTAMKTDAPMRSQGNVLSCGEAAAELSVDGCALVQAVELASSDEWSKDSEKKKIRTAGYAVIIDGVLRDFVPEEECLGVGILTGSSKNCIITVYYKNTPVTLLLVSSKCEIEPSFSGGGEVRVNIGVRLKLNVEEATLPTDITEEAVRGELEGAVAATVYSSMEAALNRSLELDADYLGVGSSINMKEPIKFAELAGGWESAFADTAYQIDVKAELTRTYDLDKPEQVTGGDERSVEP